MATTIKYIHASDFHLDIPLSGLSELPSHLVHTLANAPYDAAQKVFDLAVAERVDFVLLAGDLFDFESGNARAASFLLSQFERLASKDINVYWAAGECDQPDRWPSSIELPENVVTFSSTIVEQLDHRRDGNVIARIMASGYDPDRRTGEDFHAPDSDVFTIGLSHGELDSALLSTQHIRYWALGGRHNASKLEKTGTVVVYPGTPQGRTPKESGVHGFKLCRVDSSGKLRVQHVESDRVRWLPQKVAISDQVRLPELKNELGERALKIMTDTTDQVVLCHWSLATEGEFNLQIHKREWTNNLLEWLRDEFGRSDKGLWSVGLNIDSANNIPIQWYEEDTLFGEYLRAIGRYQSDPSLKLNLHEYLPQTVKSKISAAMGHVADTRREDILKKATLVGADYLAKHKELTESETIETA